MSVLAHTHDFTHRRALHTVSQPGPLRRLFDEVERRMTERLINGGGFQS